jgi:hypothetical protein
MKSKVIRAFTCVNTRVRYNVGDEYKADDSRIKYLTDKGYLAAINITVSEPIAHIPKAEVAAPSKAEVTHDYSTPTTNKPKRKRNESK